MPPPPPPPPPHTPSLASAFIPGGADPGPHQSVLFEGRGAGASEPSSQTTGPRPEEEPQKLDQLDRE